MHHPYGFWCLIPPLIAIGLAIATRRVMLSLLLGVVVGVIVLARQEATGPMHLLVTIVSRSCEGYLWKSLVDGDHLRVFVFTTLMGCMVGVLHQSGAMLALVAILRPIARGRRTAQLLTWLLGMVIFFDDYANTLLLGSSMRPITDHWRVSREKLAYLVDSTAAPVAGLALISTWVAGEIGYIEDGFQHIQAGFGEGFLVFVKTIPYRFYVLWALLLVPLTALMGREFGPMWRAEQQAANRPAPAAKAASEASTGRWENAVIPVVLVILVTLVLLVQTGWQAVGERQVGASWLQIVGQGNSYLALVYAALVGLGAAALLARTTGKQSARQVRQAIRDGAVMMLPALGILWFAWTLSKVTADLGTGEYLGQLLHAGVAPAWMPTVVFILASLIAFSTGSSWGTMSMLMPLVIPATYQLLGGAAVHEQAVQHPILTATIGSVLAGAIFGDHCSPISDTTVLSSQASGCDHVAHVRTQLPYALLVAALAIVCGTIPIGFGVPVWACLTAGTLALVLSLRVAGRRLVCPSDYPNHPAKEAV